MHYLNIVVSKSLNFEQDLISWGIYNKTHKKHILFQTDQVNQSPLEYNNDFVTKQTHTWAISFLIIR